MATHTVQQLEEEFQQCLHQSDQLNFDFGRIGHELKENNLWKNNTHNIQTWKAYCTEILNKSDSQVNKCIKAYRFRTVLEKVHIPPQCIPTKVDPLSIISGPYINKKVCA